MFIDCEPRIVDGVYVYSVTRLAASLAERFPHLVAKFAEYGAIVDALDAGTIAVDEGEYPVARLVGNIVNVANAPVGGRPALRILW